MHQCCMNRLASKELISYIYTHTCTALFILVVEEGFEVVGQVPDSDWGIMMAAGIGAGPTVRKR